MAVTLGDDERQYLALFEDVTGASGQDCVVQDDRLLVVVTRGEMGEAIGPQGQHVQEFEEQVGKPVRLIEAAAEPSDFVANALAPAAVYNVTISENDDTVAYAEVADEDRGVAIGKDGETIEAARTLVERHFGIVDIQLT